MLYVFLPALNFHVVYQAKLGYEFWQVPVVAIIMIAGCVLLAFLAYSFIKIEDKAKGVLILAAAFGNVTYFLVLLYLQSLFPAQHQQVLVMAILFEITLTPLGLILGSALAAHYGKQGRFSFRALILAIIKMPLLWEMFVALFLNAYHIVIPDFIKAQQGCWPMLSPG